MPFNVRKRRLNEKYPFDDRTDIFVTGRQRPARVLHICRQDTRPCNFRVRRKKISFRNPSSQRSFYARLFCAELFPLLAVFRRTRTAVLSLAFGLIAYGRLGSAFRSSGILRAFGFHSSCYALPPLGKRGVLPPSVNYFAPLSSRYSNKNCQ